MSGRLHGVGVGPGDPELLTIKARRVIEECPVVAHFAARGRPGNAWTVVASLVRPDQVVLRLEYPLTTEAVDREEYERRIAEFYDRAADVIAGRLESGDDVAVVCEGDPFFYGSYMYIHQRLATRHDTTVVPGVTSFSAASAAAGVPLVSMDETLTVVPGVRSPEELRAALGAADAAVVMKVGRNLPQVRAAAADSGLAERAVYVERASCPGEHISPLTCTDDVAAPYFSVVLVPGEGLAARSESRA